MPIASSSRGSRVPQDSSTPLAMLAAAVKVHGNGRQEPASCQSCRAKKLRCNRTQPCSNCTARGISCTFLVPPHKHKDAAAPGQSNAELLRRIERLEGLISQPRASAASSTISPLSNSYDTQQLSEHFDSPGPTTHPTGECDPASTYVETVGTSVGLTVFLIMLDLLSTISDLCLVHRWLDRPNFQHEAHL